MLTEISSKMPRSKRNVAKKWRCKSWNPKLKKAWKTTQKIPTKKLCKRWKRRQKTRETTSAKHHAYPQTCRRKRANKRTTRRNGTVQKLDSKVEKPGKTTQKIPTKKCANVGRVSRKDEKLLSTSAKHESSPQIRWRRRCNKRAAWRSGAAKNVRDAGREQGQKKGQKRDCCDKARRINIDGD